MNILNQKTILTKTTLRVELNLDDITLLLKKSGVLIPEGSHISCFYDNCDDDQTTNVNGANIIVFESETTEPEEVSVQ